MKLDYWGKTDVGLIRKNNEDAIELAPDMGLYLLSDGVGGQNAGEVASQLGIQTARKFISDIIKQKLIDKSPIEILKEAVAVANRAILDKARTKSEYDRMAATFIGVWFTGNQAHIVSVGDSRVYLYRGNRLWLLTEDQSLAFERVRNSRFQEEMNTIAFLDKQVGGNMLSQAMGSEEGVQPFGASCILKDLDVFLLCSDGLYGMMSPEDLEGHLSESGLSKEDGLFKCGNLLIQKALEGGGRDNVSIILLKVIP